MKFIIQAAVHQHKYWVQLKPFRLNGLINNAAVFNTRWEAEQTIELFKHQVSVELIIVEYENRRT